jgi:hypothetical protein
MAISFTKIPTISDEIWGYYEQAVLREHTDTASFLRHVINIPIVNERIFSHGLFEDKLKPLEESGFIKREPCINSLDKPDYKYVLTYAGKQYLKFYEL